MTYGEYMQWQKHKKGWEDRLHRALNSNNPAEALKTVEDDFKDMEYDLQNNPEAHEFYKRIEELTKGVA